MVVSISEQIWSINFKESSSNHNLFIRHIRYVDNRLIFGDKRLQQWHPYEVLRHDGFYGRSIVLETEPDQEFLGFLLETQPLELIYGGPTNVSQALSPFSASPPKVLHRGFRSRCHIVVKGAFPIHRVHQGLEQLIQLYALAGFSREEPNCISSQILTLHRENYCPCRSVFVVFPVLLFSWLLARIFLLNDLVQARPVYCCFLALAVMDGSWQTNPRQVHYHLARATMHLNYIASFLPVFDPVLDSDDSDFQHRFPSMPPPESHNIHHGCAYFCSDANFLLFATSFFAFTWWSSISYAWS